MRFRLLTIMVLAAAAATAAAAPAQEIEPSEAAAVELAAERGKLIYAYDQAAWHGTDDLSEKLPDFHRIAAGWIVDGPADAAELVFFDRDEREPKALYVARFEGQKLVSSRLLGEGDERSLSAPRKAMIAARRTAVDALIGAKKTQCKDHPFNTVVLPPKAVGQPMLVYFLTPQTEADAIPMGGHYRVEVAPDGRAVGVRAFTNTCMEMPLGKDGETPLALGITHLLDPVPTEIHVFSSLAAQLPLFVGTENGRTWEIEEGRVRLVHPGE